MFSNFKVVKVEVSKNMEKCKICEKFSPNLFTLNCGHLCCTFCADLLADKTETLSQEIIFFCPFCGESVKSLRILENNKEDKEDER